MRLIAFVGSSFLLLLMHQSLDNKVSDLAEAIAKERAAEVSGIEQRCAAASMAAVEAELAIISAEEQLMDIQADLALRRRLLNATYHREASGARRRTF